MSIWNNFLSNKCQFQCYSFPPRCTISKKLREKKEIETETILDRNILVEIKTVSSCQGTVAFQEHVAIQRMTAGRRRHPLLWVSEHTKQVPAPVTWTLCSSSTLWALGAQGGSSRPISKVGVVCARLLSLTWSETVHFIAALFWKEWRHTCRLSFSHWVVKKSKGWTSLHYIALCTWQRTISNVFFSSNQIRKLQPRLCQGYCAPCKLTSNFLIKTPQAPERYWSTRLELFFCVFDFFHSTCIPTSYLPPFLACLHPCSADALSITPWPNHHCPSASRLASWHPTEGVCAPRGFSLACFSSTIKYIPPSSMVIFLTEQTAEIWFW